jgi:hypothetical protein
VSLAEVSDRLVRQRQPEDGGPPTPLAGVLNLIAYAPGPDDVDEMRRVIERLADHQPSRVVLLVESEDGDGIDAAVSTARRAAGDGHTVAVELVVLTVHGPRRAGEASAAVPLLRPDLPTVLWWPRPPTDAPDSPLARLTPLADRVVTECGGADPAAGIACLARWAREDGPAVTDLAWAAITPWRQLIAQMLDGDALDALREGASATVAHPAPGPTAEALLMAGWLWDIVGGHGIAIALEGRPGPETPLLAVELAASGGPWCLTVERLPGRGAAAVCATDREGVSRRRVLPLPSPDRARLLAGELELQRRDRAFERALPGAMRAAA